MKTREDGSPSISHFKYTVAEKKIIKEELENTPIRTEQRIKDRFIPNQNNPDKVVFNLDDRLTFVKANMGVGKT